MGGLNLSGFPEAPSLASLDNSPDSCPQNNQSYEEVVEGSLRPGAAISEITAVSAGQLPWQPHMVVWVHMVQRWRGQGFSVVFSGWLSSIFRTTSLLSGQEVHNFQLTRQPSDNKAGPSTLPASKGSQDCLEKDLELGLSADGKDPSISSSTGSCCSSVANGSLPRERLMHQAVEDLPQGVDPARKEVGTNAAVLGTGGSQGTLPPEWPQKPGSEQTGEGESG